MSRQNQRVTIREALNQKVSFTRVGEGMLHGMAAFAALAGVLAIGLTACFCFCPREHFEVGLVLAIFIMPGIAGLCLCVLLQVIWWRRYRALHPAVRRRGFGAVLFFVGLTLCGCILLFDLLR